MLTHLFITFEKWGVMLGMSEVKRTPGNICVQTERESRGTVSPFSPASVCNMFVRPKCKMLEIYAHAEAVG